MVLASSQALVLHMKQSLRSCAQLSRHQCLLALLGAFSTTLLDYAKVLQAKLDSMPCSSRTLPTAWPSFDEVGVAGQGAGSSDSDAEADFEDGPAAGVAAKGKPEKQSFSERMAAAKACRKLIDWKN
jgi:hypothetical protein